MYDLIYYIRAVLGFLLYGVRALVWPIYRLISRVFRRNTG